MFVDGSSIAENRISDVGDMLKTFSENSEEEDRDMNINLKKGKRTVEQREKNEKNFRRHKQHMRAQKE